MADGYRRDLAVLLVVSLILRGAAALVVPWTPYLDSGYYTLVAERLATGHGFTVPVIWSFLDVGSRIPEPATLPIPSNAHWPPMAPLLSGISMVLLEPTWLAGQVPQVVVSALLPPFTYLVARELFERRWIAIGAAVLAIFAGPLFILYPAIDNFALFGFFGTAVLWTSMRAVRARAPAPWLVAAGVATGLAGLSRIDGVLLAVAPATAWLIGRGWAPWRGSGGRPSWLAGFASAAAFLVVVMPWLIRQSIVFGSPLPSAGGHTLWITGYNEQFSVSEVSLQTYLDWGLGNILGSKVASLGVIAGRVMVLMGGLLVVPFVAGLWTFRRRPELAPFLVYFLVLVAVMAGVFTFHAPESAWYHSAPAWLGFGYPVALAGVAATAAGAGGAWPILRRTRAHALLATVGIALAVGLSVTGSAALRTAWGSARERDEAVAAFFVDRELTGAVVMYHDPAILHLLSGNPVIGFPNDPYPILEEVVRAYDVSWVAVPNVRLRVPPGLWEGGDAMDANGNRATFLAREPAFETDTVRIFEVVDPLREKGG
jgi:hypothetical protein